MLLKFSGYFFTSAGFLGLFFYFNNESSTFINSPLWLLLSFVITCLGIFLFFIYKKRINSKQKKYYEDRICRLKQMGEKILLSIDNCEIKVNNYYKEVIKDGSSRIAQLDAIFDPNRNHSDIYVIQSALVYYYSSGGKRYKMTSQTFSFDTNTLTNLVESKKIILYVNPNDFNDYIFIHVV